LRRTLGGFVLFSWAVVTFSASACVNAPRKAYTPSEARTLRRIDEVMRIHAEQMEPLFDVETRTAFDDATFVQMETAATMIGEGTAIAMQGDPVAQPYPTQFVDYAKDLQAHARSLGQAAEKKDGASAQAEIAVIHHICRACHAELRAPRP